MSSPHRDETVLVLTGRKPPSFPSDVSPCPTPPPLLRDYPRDIGFGNGTPLPTNLGFLYNLRKRCRLFVEGEIEEFEPSEEVCRGVCTNTDVFRPFYPRAVSYIDPTKPGKSPNDSMPRMVHKTSCLPNSVDEVLS